MSASSSKTWGTSLASHAERAPRRAWIFPISVGALVAAMVVAIGATISVTGPWYYGLNLPAYAPDGRLFALGWTLVYGLSAIAGAGAWRASPAREGDLLIAALALTGFLNIGWSYLFFHWQAPRWALFECLFLLPSALAAVVQAARFSRGSALLLLPYLAWVSFAAWFTWDVVRLNSGS